MSIVTVVLFASGVGKIELLPDNSCYSFLPRANF